jgi:exodeoxyribonuclease VII small subunit
MADAAADKPAFEKELDELEAVVKKLESGDLPLEESLKLFERGVALSDSCRKQLDEAETRVEILLKRGSKVIAEPFTPDK